MKRYTSWQLVALAAALAFVFIACGGGDDPVAPDGDTDTADVVEIDEAEPDTALGPLVEADTTMVDFETVEPDSVTLKDVVVTNTGDQTVVLQALDITGDDADFFEVATYNGGNLIPGDSRTITFKYNPTETGGHNVTATLTSNALNTPQLEITLVGNAQVPQFKQLGFTGVGNGGEVDFGQLRVGVTGRNRTIGVKNIGNTEPVNITAVYFDEENCSDYLAFQLFMDTEPSEGSPVELNLDGVPWSFEVSYAPSGIGAETCTLVVESDSDDPGQQPVEIIIKGEGISSGLEVLPAPIDFGVVPVGETRDITIAITNRSEASIRISGANLTDMDDFTAYTLDQQGNIQRDLAVDETMEYTLSFRPTANGQNNGTLRISSDLTGASLLYFPIYGAGGSGNQPPSARVSESSHGAPIGDEILVEPGDVKTFFGDISTDADSNNNIVAFEWSWVAKPDNSFADFVPDDRSVSTTITFDRGGNYTFHLRVKDNDDAWSVPFPVNVRAVGGDDIRVSMTFADGCDGEIDVELGYQVPGVMTCTQELATNNICPLPNVNPQGLSYGNAAMIQTSNGCGDGATETIEHTGSQVDGVYRVHVKMLEDCTMRFDPNVCLAHGDANVTLRFYINSSPTANWTKSVQLTDTGETGTKRWSLVRANGEFAEPVPDN